jgi:hypothetical protein
MHCPSCGQQQVSNQTRFCSRCGLPLSVIADVVAHGGTLPQLAQLAQMNEGPQSWFTKKNGVGFSLIWFILFTIVFTSFLGILRAPGDLIGLVAVTGVFGSILMILASLFFLPSSKKPFALYPQAPMPQHQPVNLAGQYGQGALPPSQGTPVSSYVPPGSSQQPQPVPPHVAGSWRDTNDLAATSDTREEATKMLDKDEQRF